MAEHLLPHVLTALFFIFLAYSDQKNDTVIFVLTACLFYLNKTKLILTLSCHGHSKVNIQSREAYLFPLLLAWEKGFVTGSLKPGVLNAPSRY